jgi:hypothetical protein
VNCGEKCCRAARRRPARHPLPVAFSAQILQGDSYANAYTINFSDGTSSGAMTTRPSGIACTVSGPCYTGIASTSHTYTSAGTYTATLVNPALKVMGSMTITASGSAPPVTPRVWWQQHR